MELTSSGGKVDAGHLWGGEGISLVLEVCKLGFTDVLEYLFNQGVKLASFRGKVGGHFGCGVGGGLEGEGVSLVLEVY